MIPYFFWRKIKIEFVFDMYGVPQKNSGCSGNMSLFTICVCYKAYMLKDTLLFSNNNSLRSNYLCLIDFYLCYFLGKFICRLQSPFQIFTYMIGNWNPLFVCLKKIIMLCMYSNNIHLSWNMTPEMSFIDIYDISLISDKTFRQIDNFVQL